MRPEFWTDSTVATMPDSARLLYIGLWCVADDAGYLDWDMESIGMTLLGYRSPAIRRRVIEASAKTLVDARRVILLDCGKHAHIPTLPQYRIGGGNHNERVKKAHFSHGNGGTYKSGTGSVPPQVRTGTDKSRSESLSGSLSESESESLSPRRGANGSTTTGDDEYGRVLADRIQAKLGVPG